MVEIMKESIPRNLKNYVIIDVSFLKKYITKYFRNLPTPPLVVSPHYHRQLFIELPKPSFAIAYPTGAEGWVKKWRFSSIPDEIRESSRKIEESLHLLFLLRLAKIKGH